MQNVQKYFLILESLQFDHNTHGSDADKNLKTNLSVLEKYLKDVELNTNSNSKQHTSAISSENNESWKCTQFLLHLILTIKSNVNLDSNEKEDLISLRHQNELLNAIKLVSRYGVIYNLPSVLQQHPIFNSKNGENADTKQLRATLLDLSEIFSVNLIASNHALDSVVLEMIAGIYSINDSSLDFFLKMLWERTAKENYFRYLLILKSIKGLPKETQESLHKGLLDKLVEAGGFKLLVLNTVPTMNTSTTSTPNWKRYDVVANIIAHKGHSNAFYQQMIEQIFDFIQNSLDDVMESSLIPAGVVTLRKLSTLNDKLRSEVEGKIKEMYKLFVEPTDILSGLVVLEAKDIQMFVKLQCTLFNGSSFEALPSEILVKYIPLLMSLFLLLDGYDVAKDLASLISQCLANRELNDLGLVLNALFNKSQKEIAVEYLHHKIGLQKLHQFGLYQLQIMPEEFQYAAELPTVLVKILKISNNNILSYNCFVRVLMIFEEIGITEDTSVNEIDLLLTEEELEEFLACKFQTRLSVISYLTDMLSFRQFHSQFHENPGDVIDFIQNAIERRLKHSSNAMISDENLPILLAVFHEFIETSKDFTKYRGIKNSLMMYQKCVNNEELKNQIYQLVMLIENGPRTTSSDSSEYEFARSLISESQSHLRVYGITQLIKLLTNRNEEALSNRHAILAMAMHALRDNESYTYLNCVRLFVCLMNCMQADVLDALSAEYLNENENIEFRLKVGEAILKVTEDLGPISYNFKDILINCFLHGSANKLDEFRASSMSNLSTVCRLLSYQVHNFFNELMIMIESTLQTDTYLPARRASVLILSQLLWGIDSLVDFQETLLPIYRLLRTIVESDKDEKTRIHATNGLKCLKEKCKAFLFADPKMEKEIKIFGIKDDDSKGKVKKNHILEL